MNTTCCGVENVVLVAADVVDVVVVAPLSLFRLDNTHMQHMASLLA